MKQSKINQIWDYNKNFDHLTECVGLGRIIGWRCFRGCQIWICCQHWSRIIPTSTQAFLNAEWSPLHTIRLYSWTMTKSFFRKKIWILRNGVRTPLHTVRHRQQFLQVWISSSEQRKIAFEFCPETAPLSEDGAKMLYTRFAFRSFFVILLIFRYCLR